MSSQLARLYVALGDLVEPLRERIGSVEALEYLAHRYGWAAPLDDEAFGRVSEALAVREPLDRLLEIAARAREKLTAGEDVPPEEVAELVAVAVELIPALAALRPSQIAGLAQPYNSAEFWESVAEHLLDDLLEEYLRVYQRGLFALLRLGGVIRYEPLTPDGPFRRPYTRTSVDFGQLVALTRDPAGALRQAYAWGDPQRAFDHRQLFGALTDALHALRLPTAVLTPAIQALPSFPADPSREIPRDLPALRTVLWQGAALADQALFRAGFEVYPAARAGEPHPSGLVVRPLLEGEAGASLPLGRHLTLRWQAAASAGDAIGFALFPDAADIIGGDAAFGTRVEIASTGEAPWYLLGGAGASHLQVTGLAGGFTLGGSAGDPEVELRLTTDCKIVILLDEADQLVGEVVNRSAIELGFAPTVSWSSKSGFAFEGMPRLDLRVPLGLTLGPITLTSVTLSLAGAEDGDQDALLCRAGVGIQGKFGPVQVVVEDMGLACRITRLTPEEVRALPPGEAPSLGGLDLDFAFAPPRGIGISVDAKVITGGGYLEAFPERGEYLGFAHLTLQNRISVKAFGVVLTRPQVSFLLIISAEFPPIQLGLGFRLDGVGGIIGIRRRLDAERLLAGLRDDLLDDVLFPEDPSKDPHAMVSRVAALFPATDGQHVFGPSALISWGAAGLLKIKLALVIELPSFRISTFGVLQARVAKRVGGQELSVLELQVNFAGIFDFEERFVRFDASLYRSRLLGLTLDGEMAWRLKFGGGAPELVMTMGGFHPDFQPPALALPPDIKRLQITIASGNPHIWVDAYFAITSNTVQFGASGHLRFSKWGVGVSGDVGFDALFQFSPFRFEASVFLLLSASWKGVDFTSIEVTGTFSGPSPWRIKGQFKLKICWFLKITVPIDESWGDGDETVLGEVDVLPLLVEDLSAGPGWERAPGRTSLLVTCRSVQTEPNELLLHPNDLLVVRQSTVPLGVAIDKLGERRPHDGRTFALRLRRDGSGMEGTPVRAHFAPGQFFHRTDAERLNAGSYELFEAGAGFEELDAVALDAWSPVDVAYETGYVDEPGLEPPEPAPPAPEPRDRFLLGLRNNAIANSELGRRSRPREGGTVPAPGERWVVTGVTPDGSGEPLVAATEVEARALLRELAGRVPGRLADLAVLPVSDLSR